MRKTKVLLAFMALTLVQTARAESPADLVAVYAAAAVKSSPGFTPSAERGRALFNKDWGVSQKMPSCLSCHGKDIGADGKHVITGKRIAPLATRTNPERFTSTAKVEKWFRRNCSEVVGRECSAAEKADFILFVSQ